MSARNDKEAPGITADGLVELEESVLDGIAGGNMSMDRKPDAGGKKPPQPEGKEEVGSKKKDVSPTGSTSAPPSPAPPPPAIFTI